MKQLFELFKTSERTNAWFSLSLNNKHTKAIQKTTIGSKLCMTGRLQKELAIT